MGALGCISLVQELRTCRCCDDSKNRHARSISKNPSTRSFRHSSAGRLELVFIDEISVLT